MTAKAAVPRRRRNWALLGLACVLPAALFWLLMTVGIAVSPGLSAIAPSAWPQPVAAVFIVSFLLLLPLAGGIFGLLGLRRNKMLAIIVMVLGLGAVVLNLIMQSN